MNKIKQIGIFGTAGMAREAGDIALSLGLEPIYVAKSQAELNQAKLQQTVILEKDLCQHASINYVIGIGDSNARKVIAEQYKNIVNFTNLFHPSATFGFNQREVMEQSVGLIVAAGARLTSGISLGSFCIFNQNSTVAHDCLLGNFIHIAPGANVSGNVQIQDDCWIGAGSTINQGNQLKKLIIGANTVIGSGAVVIEDCEPNAVYIGVPAKRIK